MNKWQNYELPRPAMAGYKKLMAQEMLIHSREEMQAFAAKFANDFSAGDVLLLKGDLGAGKTTFTQGLAKALGVTESVTSPTFALVAEYPVTQHGSIKLLVHIDLYRLETAVLAKEGAVLEALSRSQTDGRLTVIEWAEKLGRHMPKGAHTLEFKHGANATERIVIES